MGLFDSLSGFGSAVSGFLGDVAGGFFGGAPEPDYYAGEYAQSPSVASQIGSGLRGGASAYIQSQITGGRQCFPGIMGEVCVGGTKPGITHAPSRQMFPTVTTTAPGISGATDVGGANVFQVTPTRAMPSQPASLGSGPESTLVAQSGIYGLAAGAPYFATVAGELARKYAPRIAKFGLETAGAIAGHEALNWIFGEEHQNIATEQRAEVDAIYDRSTYPGGQSMPVLPGGAVVGQSMVGQPYGGLIFQPRPTGPRARSVLQIPNPYTGRTMWYRNMGQPILWSGDLSSAKRVRKAASRARRGR